MPFLLSFDSQSSGMTAAQYDEVIKNCKPPMRGVQEEDYTTYVTVIRPALK